MSKDERLRKRPEFLKLSNTGQKQHTTHFIIIWSLEGRGLTRVGITVSKKVGNAVVRNRIRRLVREYFRLNKVLFPAADFNFIAKRGADELDFTTLRQELDRAMKRLAGV